MALVTGQTDVFCFVSVFCLLVGGNARPLVFIEKSVIKYASVPWNYTCSCKRFFSFVMSTENNFAAVSTGVFNSFTAIIADFN